MKTLFALLMLFASTLHAQALLPDPEPKTTLVTVFGPIDHAMAEKVAGQLLGASELGESVTMVIDSPGGDVSAGDLIVSAMQLSKNPIHTICIGTCASMAAFVFEFGAERTMWPRATLMFHQPHYSLEGNPGQVRSELRAFDKDVAYYENYVAKRAGLSLPAYRALVADELWLTSEDAVAKKLVDGIGAE